jgi:hypothetical protein
MPDYRVFTLKNGKRIVGTPEVLQSASDQQAQAETRRLLLDGLDLEIWHGARLVMRLRPDHK